MVRKSPVNNDTWLDFVTPDRLCGLCGNTGEIRTVGVKSPLGRSVPSVWGYCICPNGRAIKWAAKRYGQAMHTSPERVQNEAGNTQVAYDGEDEVTP